MREILCAHSADGQSGRGEECLEMLSRTYEDDNIHFVHHDREDLPMFADRTTQNLDILNNKFCSGIAASWHGLAEEAET